MSRTLALCDEVSTPNVMPHLSSTLGNRASTSAPPEPTRPPTISYISTQVEAEGPQGRLNPKDYEMSIENHRQSPARNGGLEHLDSPFAICQDALQRIKDLRTDALSLRSQIREKRTKLMEKQRAQQMADDLLLQRLRQQFLGQVVKHNSLVPGGKTIEDLMQDCNNARDEYGPLEDDYNRPEDQLDRQEFRLIAMENEFYKQSKENISQGPIRSPNDQEDIAYALREDCFSRGLIDESGKATDFPSQGQESYPARLKHDSTTCDSCGSENIAGYYYCSTCPRDGYGICFSCTDKGLSCPGQDHDLLKRIFDTKSRIFVDEELYTPARGLRVFVKGQLTSGIGDTGSEETIISEERCRQMGEQVIPDPMWITLGNQRRMYSLGKVNIPVAFPDTPGQIVMVLARVVKQFSFDLLLGNPFLEATQTMEKYIHRFVCCLFPTRNLWSFYRVGETRRRFKATMGNDILFEALADTGSRRNIMRADWAFQQRFEVRSKPENLGWITFPTGPEEATIGQVHTHISLPDGKLVPTIFDVLPTCRLSVVLGIDFVLDSNIYQNYASSFFDLQTDGDEEASCCMGMGRIPWFVKVGNSIKNAVYKTSKETTSLTSSTDFATQVNNNNPGQGSNSCSHPYSDTAELKRQIAWDRMYDGGKKASVEEWNVEIQRRRVHEETFYPDHQANPPTSLISPTPLTSHPDSARPPTHVQTTASNDAAEANATTLTETGSTSNHESTDEGSLAWSPEGLNGVAPVLNCTTPFGQLEAAQWQT